MRLSLFPSVSLQRRAVGRRHFRNVAIEDGCDEHQRAHDAHDERDIVESTVGSVGHIGARRGSTSRDGSEVLRRPLQARCRRGREPRPVLPGSVTVLRGQPESFSSNAQFTVRFLTLGRSISRCGKASSTIKSAPIGENGCRASDRCTAPARRLAAEMAPALAPGPAREMIAFLTGH
jgi:hypothetical protein